jgi:DNA modification methylase
MTTKPKAPVAPSDPQSEAGDRLAVTYRPIAALKPDPRNPRSHGKRQIKQLARSIGAFGFNVPILVDRGLTIVAGHARLLAAQSLGQAEVPTIQLEHLSEAQAKAFAIADNRLCDLSKWDEDLLAGLLLELSEQDLSFDLEAIGFSMGEIDLMIEGLGVGEAAPESADTPPPAGPAVCRTDDLYQCGNHMVRCGDARDSAAYAALMGDERAAMVFADPPYNVRIDGHVGGSGAIRHREFAMASGEMSDDEYTAFLTAVFGNLAAHSTDGSLHYQFTDWRHHRHTQAAGSVAYAEQINLCVWAKDRPGMGSFYRSQHELVLVFKSSRGPHRNNIELGRFGRNRSNLWCYPAIAGMRHGEEGDLLALHPTVKPVRLVADAIMDCTARGDIVLDPFLGSGTTLIAAERTGRRCFGMEIDPLYVDTAIRRWQAWTGEQAVHAASGRTFDDLAAEADHGE